MTNLSIRNRSALAAVAAIAFVTWGVGLADEPSSRADDETAIRQRASDYLSAIDRGDVEEIASFWTADGDYLDEAGHAAKGRWLARQPRERSAVRGDGSQLTVTVEAIRFITPDVAVEDGTLSASLGKSAVRRYTAIWARQDGKWLLDGVRELAVQAASHHDRLGDLSWMLGDWVSDDDGKTVQLACAWSADEHFLLREIKVSLPDREPLHVTQRIGWDAHDKQIKSWTFDSEGGHGEGLWFQQGDRWIVEAESVLPDGSVATGTNVYFRDADDSFVWESSNALINGEPAPDQKVRMVQTAKANKR